MASVIQTSDSTFQADVLNAKEFVFVDFWAPWCGPCKQVAPLIDEMAKEFPNIKFAKLNTDENPHIQQTYSIRGIPALAIFKDGQIVKMEVGALNRDALRQFISSTCE